MLTKYRYNSSKISIVPNNSPNWLTYGIRLDLLNESLSKLKIINESFHFDFNKDIFRSRCEFLSKFVFKDQMRKVNCESKGLFTILSETIKKNSSIIFNKKYY